MTNFDELAELGLPREHRAVFKVGEEEYEVYLTQITKSNPYDCAVDFPDGFVIPEYCKHFDVTFDTKANRLSKTYFKRAKLPDGASIRVFKCVERIILDHYNTFRVGIYTFAPADHKLTSAYCRFVSLKRHRGSTIEVGFEPMGRANVLRTPKFYG